MLLKVISRAGIGKDLETFKQMKFQYTALAAYEERESGTEQICIDAQDFERWRKEMLKCFPFLGYNSS